MTTSSRSIRRGLRYRVRSGIATRARHDHVLRHPAFGELPRYAPVRTADLALAHRVELLEALGPDRPPRWPRGRPADADRRYLDALLAGRDPDDPRRSHPGTAERHERLVALARELRPPAPTGGVR